MQGLQSAIMDEERPERSKLDAITSSMGGTIMTRMLNFSSSTTETLLGGTNYNITQSGGGTGVTLNVILPSTIDQDTLQGGLFTNGDLGEQTLNFNIMKLTGGLSASNEGKAVLNGNILINDGSIVADDASNITINTALLGGSGMTFISGSTVTEDGLVGGGQTVDVGTGGLSGFFVIGNPNQFFGDVDIQRSGYVDLADLRATSYNYLNGVLTLWNGNRPVDRLHLTSENGFSVFQVNNPGILTSGVWVSSGEPAVGTMLPVHSTAF